MWTKASEEGGGGGGGGGKECYECKAFAADLHIVFTINTLTDNPQVHPKHFCTIQCKRVISAKAGGVHHRCALTPFVWAVHTNEGCKVYVRNIMHNNTAGV